MERMNAETCNLLATATTVEEITSFVEFVWDAIAAARCEGNDNIAVPVPTEYAQDPAGLARRWMYDGFQSYVKGTTLLVSWQYEEAVAYTQRRVAEAVQNQTFSVTLTAGELNVQSAVPTEGSGVVFHVREVFRMWGFNAAGDEDTLILSW